ncbi:hypothetical protein RMATCC62417_08804 [Rhizopus microsporus]|nr:hypothetical protein RMATCC62417_08804 [Rhizopus microsporus]
MYQPQQGQQQQQYYPPPPTMQQNQNYYPSPEQQQHPPPDYNTSYQQQAPYSEEPNKGIKPSSGWNDVWATVLWLINLGAFIGLAVVAISTYNSHGTTYGGVQSSNPYPGLTFDTSTFAIFGYAAVVGFGISLLYLIIANMIPGPLIYITFIGSIIVYFGVTIYYFVRHYYSAAIIFLIFSCLYALCFFWWRSRIPFATGKSYFVFCF